MSDYIELVIKIPKEDYIKISNNNPSYADDFNLYYAVKNGTTLPKGHGDLVDISPYKGKVICSHLYSGVKKLIEVNSIKPIIEADKSESEDKE